MIKVICDRCKCNCELQAYDILVRVISNPSPHHCLDTDDLRITDDYSRMRMVVCQKCYNELNLPNIHTVNRTKELNFDTNNYDNEEDK